MRSAIVFFSLCSLVVSSSFGQAAWAAGQSSLKAQRSRVRSRLGVKPMARSNQFRWSVLRQKNIPYNQRQNWTVKTLGFDAQRRTVIKAVNKRTGESYYAKAKVDGWSYDVKLVKRPGKTMVPVLHTNAYREAFFKAAGMDGDQPQMASRQKRTSMTTVAVTNRGESIMAINTPGASGYSRKIVLAKGSYSLANGEVGRPKVQILSDKQLQQLGLFTSQELQAMAAEHSSGARYKGVNGQLRGYSATGRKTSVKFTQRADSTMAKTAWGSTVEIVPKGRSIERWVHVLTGAETARNPRAIYMNKADLKAAYEQIFK